MTAVICPDHTKSHRKPMMTEKEIGKADSDKPSKAIFTNTYNKQCGYMDLRVHKTYENETGSDALTQDQFRFRLEAAGDNKATPCPVILQTDRSLQAIPSAAV
ncbi:MAG: hypothetical protein V8Q42_04760 [Anaerovoracaceae bacterium]